MAPPTSSSARLQQRPRLEALYPEGLASASVDWESIQIPGPPPRYREGQVAPGCVDPSSRWARSLIQQYRVAHAGRGPALLEFVDKIKPHAHSDLMCCYAGAGQDGTLAGLPVAAQTALWATALNFIAYCEARGQVGDRLWIAYNSDPHTEDRPSCQGEARFHLHLIRWRASELASLRSRPFASLGQAEQRRLVDPLAYLGAEVAADLLASSELGARLRVSPQPSSAPGLRLIPRGPVSAASLQRDVLALHELIEAGARAVEAAIVAVEAVDPAALAELRPPLRSLAQIEARLGALAWLSTPTRARLLLLAACLRSPTAVEQRALAADPELAVARLALRQPAYALGMRPLSSVARRRLAMVEPELASARVELVVQFKLLSDIGGAGVVDFDELIAAKIGREYGRWDERAWAERAWFQTDFLRTNAAMIGRAQPELAAALDPTPMAEFRGFDQGWVMP